jgi:hypothetical protein
LLFIQQEFYKLEASSIALTPGTPMQIHHRRSHHPLLTAAAVSVIVVSVLGIASITGVLPAFHGMSTEKSPVVTAAVVTSPALANLPVKTSETLAPGESLVPAENFVAAVPAIPAAAVTATTVTATGVTTPAVNAAAVAAAALAVPPAKSSDVAVAAAPLAQSAAPKPSVTPAHEAKAAITNRKAPALASVHQQSRRRQPEVVTTSGNTAGGEFASGRAPHDAIDERASVPRITPVYRPTGPSYSAELSERAPVDDAGRQQGAAGYRDEPRNRVARAQSYRRAGARDSDNSVDAPAAGHTMDPAQSGPGEQAGTMMRGTIGENIDRTISFISSVLTGRPATTQPAPGQPVPYSQGAYAQ